MPTILIVALCLSLSLVLICWIRYRRRMVLNIGGKAYPIGTLEIFIASIEHEGFERHEFLSANASTIISQLKEMQGRGDDVTEQLRRMGDFIPTFLHEYINSNNRVAIESLLDAHKDLIPESVANSAIQHCFLYKKSDICTLFYDAYPNLRPNDIDIA